MRTCKKCGEAKLESEFNFSSPGVLRWQCKHCQKKYDKRYRQRPEVVKNNYRRNKEWRKAHPDVYRFSGIKHSYGITRAQYEAHLRLQNNCCAICKLAFDIGKHRLHIDHCHVTNQFRGFLCGRCNTGLGQFQDSFQNCIRAADYLRKFPPFRSTVSS